MKEDNLFKKEKEIYKKLTEKEIQKKRDQKTDSSLLDRIRLEKSL